MDGQGRSRFWASDGTPKGTQSLNLTIPAAVQNPRVHNGRILFGTSDGHLRSTDLEQIYDLGAGPAASYIERAGKDLILFGDDDAEGNPTVWKTDATPAGTAFLAALPDVQFAGDERARLGNLAFFTGWHDGQTHDHLYVSDGTPQGTKPFRHDLTSVSHLQRRGRRIFFRAMNPDTDKIGWFRSDGTPKATVPIKALPVKPYEDQLIGTINGKHVHSARHDGGTLLVTDPDADTNVLYRTKLTYSSNPGDLTVSPGGDLYFTTASTSYSGPEPWEEYVYERALWRKSGNKAPVKLADLPGSIGHLSPARDVTFFTVRISDDDPRTSHDFPKGHSELWRTDGTRKGTFKLTDNANRLTFGGGPPFPIAQLVGDTMYFYVGYKSPHFGSDESEESMGALWKSDGTKAGTVKVTDAKIREMSAAGDRLYFIDGEGALWTSDGTADGTERLSRFADGAFGRFIPTKRGIFFTRETDYGSDSLDDINLYFTDGTPANTHHLGGFLEDRVGYSFRRQDWYAEVKGNLFFIANTPEHGPELWKSNGTPEGTALVTDIREGAEGSNPTSITEHEGFAWFFADDGKTGPQLWRSNGRASGTRIVKKFKLDNDLNENPHSALASLAGGIVFQKSDPDAMTNHEIFFGDLDTGFRSLGKYTTQSAGLRTTPPAWVYHNGKLLFSATHRIYHNELWQADL